MTEKRISDAFLRTATCPHEKEYFDYHDRGLTVRVSKYGIVSFRHTYRMAGKRRNLTIGRYPDMSLSDARKMVAEAKVSVQNGIDPQQARDDSKRAIEENLGMTLGQGLDTFIDRHAKPNIKSWGQYQSYFDRLPSKIKNMSIESMGKTTLRDYLQDVGKNATHSSANNAYKYLKSACTWLEDNEYIEDNPMLKVKKPFPSADKSRHRVLSDDELKTIIQFAKEEQYPMGHWLVVLSYVGQRREEVAAMRWSELDFNNAIWTIPAERTKNGKEHKVPLCKTVMEILITCPRFRNGGDYVFSTEYGKTHVSGYSKFKGRVDKETGIHGWTFHDLRRTLATNLSKSRVSDTVISAVLNHSTAKLQGVTSIYNQHDYLAERMTALNNYGAWLDRLVAEDSGDNVVPLMR